MRRIGLEGGALKTGRFNSNAFGDVIFISMGPKDDSLWVQEVATGFPRTSRWSLDGKLLQQWFTPKLELFSETVNLARPNELLTTYNAFTDEPGIRSYEVDWDQNTWKPGWFFDNKWADMFAGTNDVYLGYEHGGNPLNGPRGGKSPWPVFHYAARNFVSHGEQNYFMNGEGNDDGTIFQYSPYSKPKPVAMIGFHHVTKLPDGRYQGSYDQGKNEWITWADRNGDGIISLDEITYVKDVPELEGCIRVASGEIDSNLNVHFQMLTRDNKGQRFLYILKPTEILPNGTPVYDWSKVQKEMPISPPNLLGGDGVKQIAHLNSPVPLRADDALYALIKPSPAKKLDLPGIDGATWWASRNWRDKLCKFDSKTGELIWAVGRRAPGRAEPGQMYHPTGVSGKAGDEIFVADTLGPLWVWHTDGLFIGHLFTDHQPGDKVPVDQELYGEIQSTFVFKHPQTGKIYHVGAGTETRIHEIIMPPVERLSSSSVTLTEKPEFTALFTNEKVKIDGDLGGNEGWYGSNENRRVPMLVLLDGQRVADVRVMYDAEKLYLGYNVSHPAGYANAGSELPYCPFVSGAYVDFSIAPDWSKPQRSEVREGDLRVIMARVTNIGTDESNYSQGFWQKKSGGTNPRTISSPAATVHFDQIGTVPGLQFAYKMKSREERTGNVNYTVEVAVPLASLGLSNVAGKTIGFDISIGVAAPTGDQRDRAAHWAGLSEGRVVDRPGSTELLPQTWGSLHFEPATPTKP